MDTNKEKIFEVAKNIFYRNGKRKEVIEFIESKGILGEDADQLATVAYKSVKGKIHQAIEVREHTSHGGPIGKIAIGLLAIGIGIIGLFVLDLTFYFIFLFGFGFLLTGIIGLFVNPAKTKVD